MMYPGNACLSNARYKIIIYDLCHPKRTSIRIRAYRVEHKRHIHTNLSYGMDGHKTHGKEEELYLFNFNYLFV